MSDYASREIQSGNTETVLLTGPTGLVGIHLLLELTRKGHRVLAVRRPLSDVEQVWRTWRHHAPTEEIESLKTRIKWVEADLLDECEMRDIMEGIRTVYHTAAMVTFNSSRRNEMIDFNLGSTRLLVNLSLEKGVETFAYVSSTSTLGTPLYGEPATESLVGAPDKRSSGYSVSKFLSENEVWRGVAEGLQTVIVNPSVIIGPGNWNRSSSRFFPTLWKGMKFYTGGGAGFVDVRDVAFALVALVENRCFGERFILSAGDLDYRELFTRISSELGKKPPAHRAPGWILELLWRVESARSRLTGSEPLITRETVTFTRRTFRYSSQKLKDRLGFAFRPLEESIKDTAKFFLTEKTEAG